MWSVLGLGNLLSYYLHHITGYHYLPLFVAVMISFIHYEPKTVHVQSKFSLKSSFTLAGSKNSLWSKFSTHFVQRTEENLISPLAVLYKDSKFTHLLLALGFRLSGDKIGVEFTMNNLTISTSFMNEVTELKIFQTAHLFGGFFRED